MDAETSSARRKTGLKCSGLRLAAIGSAEAVGEARQSSLADREAQVGHQLLVETEIVLGHQHRAEDLARTDEVVEISAAPGRADRAGAGRVERPPVLCEL